jgi:mevalonate pyrophosphate decarboxylase
MVLHYSFSTEQRARYTLGFRNRRDVGRPTANVFGHGSSSSAAAAVAAAAVAGFGQRVCAECYRPSRCRRLLCRHTTRCASANVTRALSHFFAVIAVVVTVAATEFVAVAATEFTAH